MSSGALFVVPIPIADGGALLGTNVVGDDPNFWASGTTYDLGDLVLVEPWVYKSKQANNTNHNPLTSSAWWTRVSAAHRLLMFDQKVGSQTQNEDYIEVAIKPNDLVNVISVRNVVASSVTVVQETEAEGQIYSKTIVLDEPVADWFEYFFADIVMQSEAVFTGMAQFTDATYWITINNPGGIAQCGELIMGPAMEPGRTQAGVTDGIDDYSIIAPDEFGVRDIVERDFADNMDLTVLVDRHRSAGLKRLLTDNRARAILVIASSARPDAQVYGFAESWRRILSYPSYDVFNITMRGLT